MDTKGYRYPKDPILWSVVQGHRFIKKHVRSMFGFETFNSARDVLGGVKVAHMIRKGQLAPSGLSTPRTAAEQFYQVAA